eukprot:10710450-Alexandrium_andersonii.AAC.1
MLSTAHRSWLVDRAPRKGVAFCSCAGVLLALKPQPADRYIASARQSRQAAAIALRLRLRRRL